MILRRRVELITGSLYVTGHLVMYVVNHGKYVLIVALYLLAGSYCYAETVIGSVRFEGNEKTKVSVLRREMYISEGDELDYTKIERSLQGIRDLGLFKRVSYYIAEDFTHDTKSENITELVIVVEEKIYTLIIPRIKYQDNQLRLGVHLRMDNIFGLDHSLRYLVERKGKFEGIDEYRQRMNYNYPNINGSKYSMNFTLVDENTVIEQIDNSFENNLNQSFSVALHKWLNPGHRKVGRYISAGIGHVSRIHEALEGAYVDDVMANSLVFEYGYRKVHEFAYNRSGRHYGYAGELSNEAIGSESEYFKHLLFYRAYYRFDSRPDDNLNVQTQIGYSDNNILGDEAFTLDFRNDLRGYERDRFSGNSMILVNMEYMTPSSYYPTLRYVGFLDLGNTYDSEKSFQPDGLNVGMGVGIRWKIPAFVKADLRIDIGYGVSDENYQITVGTRYAF